MNYKFSIKDVRFILPWLFFSILISCTANKKVSDNLKNKEVFTKGFPITLSFRADKFGMNDGYETWEKSYLSVNSITKKYLTEEVDMDPIIAEYANQFAESHPEKLMLLHLNGEGMSIKSKEIHDTFFPGHWIYESGTIPVTDIDETQTEIMVETAKPFSERAYIIHGAGKNLGTLPHDLIIVETDSAGNRLWDKYEYVTIGKVDGESNRIKVKRGQYFTQPRSFSKGKTYIAPLAGASWGGNLMWYYNLSSTCPKDKNGKNCADIFLGLIKGWFAEDGILKNLDGIGYDVNYFVSDHKTWDCNNDGVADKGIVNGKNVWREGDWRFLQELRAHFGPDFIITADGWRDEMQRAVGLLNGMETEGLCRPNDGYRQISRTINQHIYWNMHNDSKYKFSYITSKLNNPSDVKIGTQLRRMGIGLASCLGVAYTTLPEQMPEANGGTLNKPNWLGQTKSDIVFPAKGTPDLLQGAGVTMSESLINQFNFEGVNHKVENGTLFIKGTNDDPYAEIRVEGPAVNLHKGDLVVFFEAKGIEGYKDFKQTDRVPRKINIRINGLPVSTLTNDSNMYLSMHNDLAGFMGTSGYTPLSFYFRNVGNDSAPIRITIEAEEQGEFAIRNLTVQNAPCTVAREFQNGVVLVNPSFDTVNFNLTELFPGIKKLHRINAEKVGRGTSVSDSTEIFNHNNGEEITDLSNVRVSGLNALFLVKE